MSVMTINTSTTMSTEDKSSSSINAVTSNHNLGAEQSTDHASTDDTQIKKWIEILKHDERFQDLIQTAVDEKVDTLIKKDQSAQSGQHLSKEEVDNTQGGDQGSINREKVQLSRSKSTANVMKKDIDRGYRSLPRDTFTLMIVTEPLSKPWFYGLLLWVFQMMTLTLVLFASWDKFDDMPYTFDWTLFTAQTIALFIALLKSDDLQDCTRDFFSIYCKPNVWKDLMETIRHHKDQKCESGDKSNDEGSQNKTSNVDENINLRLLLPLALKFSEGCFVMVVTTILVLQSDNVVELFKDLTAMFLISSLDDLAFDSAESHRIKIGSIKKAADLSKSLLVQDIPKKIIKEMLKMS
jgi:hypothetical protein